MSRDAWHDDRGSYHLGTIRKMNNLESAIKEYEKSAENLANAAAVATASKRLDITVEEGRELMDRISFGELLGARAERSILEAVALGVAIEVVKMKINENK